MNRKGDSLMISLRLLWETLGSGGALVSGWDGAECGECWLTARLKPGPLYPQRPI